MRRIKHEILIAAKNAYLSEVIIEKEIENLENILSHAESPPDFCRTHELVTRNRITSNSKKILQAIKHAELKPFWFLLGLN